MSKSCSSALCSSYRGEAQLTINYRGFARDVIFFAVVTPEMRTILSPQR